MNRSTSVLFALLSAVSIALAQVGINDDQSDPAASAMLDVVATDKGVLIPRLTAVQRDAIDSPATGLLVYVTDAGVFNYYDGVLWRIVGDGAVDLTDYLNGSDLADIASIASAVPSASAPVADAANATATGSIGANGGKWQSFVAQQTGDLAMVLLEFAAAGEITFNSFQIYTNTDPDSPFIGGTLLYEASNFTATGPSATIVLEGSVPVFAGQRYFIVIEATGNWRINNDGNDVYADGRAITGPTADLAFSTFVRRPVLALTVDGSTGNVALADGAVTVAGSGTGRMVFNAETGAVFAGVTDVSGYEPEGAGSYSTGFGHNALASGLNAFAVGEEVIASGDYSMALGRESVASGKFSLAMGDPATASAQASVAIGDGAKAGDWIIEGFPLPGMATGAVAFGKDVNANAPGAFAIGQDTDARGVLSFAFGNRALTEGENAVAAGNRAEAYGARSVAMGDRVKAYGDASVAFGLRNNAQSFAEFVVGSYTPDYVPQSTTEWNAADRAFVVGNGADSGSRSTALIVYKGGDATLNGQLTLASGGDSITFPNTDGSAGQVLVSDGAGALSWDDRYSADLSGIATVVGAWNGALTADTSNEVGGESYDLHDGEARQTFTAGQSGELREVEVFLYTAGDPTPFLLEIYAGDYAADALGGSPLVTQAFVMTAPGWAEVVFESGPELVSGSIYTIVLTIGETEEVGFWYQAQSEDPYAGGRASTNPADDFLFRTSVMAPQDVSLLALDQSSGEVSLGNGNVVIDSGASPDHALTVNGGLRVVNGTEAPGYLAVSDGNGTLLWVDPTSVATAPDGDGSAFNELQTLSRSGTDLTLSNGGGAVSIADGDSDASNELQTISLSGTDLTLSDGGGTVSIVDGDADAANELQTLSFSGDTLTLTDGGAVDLSGYRSDGALSNVTSLTGPLPVDASSAAVDQANLFVDSTVFFIDPIRQSFTAGVSGILHSVLINIDADNHGILGDLTVNIYEGSYAEDTSGATLLGSGTLALTGDTGWLEIVLTDTITLAAANVYTMEFSDSPTLGGLDPRYSTGNRYAGGTMNGPVDRDLTFQTKMRYPVPLLSLNDDGSLSLGTSAFPVEALGDFRAGSMRLQDGNQASGRVLTSDVNGVMTWTNPTSISTAPDGDGSATNELQTLSLSGANLTLSSGGGTVSINDDDSSATNELQTLSQSGDTVTLSNGGGSVTVPWAVSGTNISSTNTGNVGLGTITPDTKLSVVGYVRAAFEEDEINVTEIGHGGLHGFIRKRGAGNLDFRTDSGTLMSLTDDGELGIGTDDPTAKLDVNGTVRIRSGTPTAGMVLTAIGTDGTASWKAPGLTVVTATAETITSQPGTATGWQNIGLSSGALTGLAVGDKVMVTVSCIVRISDLSATDPTDDYAFRFQSSGAATINSMDTGLMEIFGLQRGWQMLSFHRVMTIGTAGDYAFRMQVEMSNGDELLAIDQQEITAFKL